MVSNSESPKRVLREPLFLFSPVSDTSSPTSDILSLPGLSELPSLCENKHICELHMQGCYSCLLVQRARAGGHVFLQLSVLHRSYGGCWVVAPRRGDPFHSCRQRLLREQTACILTWASEFLSSFEGGKDIWLSFHLTWV